ncbi:MAG: hypothetical protein CM15mP18_0990 [Methanobacteriota archaeon]|nr:MAG: hypothetical protein CM15mP18_0990 [Euryarchaeota archaeon]
MKDALDTAEEVVDTVRRPVEAAIHGGLATAKALTGVARTLPRPLDQSERSECRCVCSFVALPVIGHETVW